MQSKKLNLNKFDILRTVMAIGIALIISTIIIFFVSQTPVEALKQQFFGPFQKLKYFANVLEMMIPMTFTGLALCIMYQQKAFSLIPDACFFMGAVVATAVGIKIIAPGGSTVLAIALSSLVGGLIALIPAFMKIKWKADELVTSLMLNYIFFFFGMYIINYYLRDPQANVFSSYKFGAGFVLPVILQGTRLHLGAVFALLAVFLIYMYVYKTKQGYEIRTLGNNINFAKYSGINTEKAILISQFIAGTLAGMGGGIEIAGMYKRFVWEISPSYAWDGVIVALLARNNPKYVLLSAFFLSYLRIGADLMSRRTDVATEIVSIIQAVMILLIAAERFLAYLKQKEERKNAKENYIKNKLGGE